MVKRGKAFQCKPCNSARQAVVRAYKNDKRGHIWNKMSVKEQHAEIMRNRGKQQGRGRKFPVEIQERAT